MKLLLLIFLLVPIHAETVNAPILIEPAAPVVMAAEATTTEIASPEPSYEALARAKIDIYAAKYGADPHQMYLVSKCECPSFKPDCPSDVIKKDGTMEQSYGVAQIHLPDHPEITYKQATDIDFSYNFMARQFAAGHKSLWSCFTLLKKNGEL